MDFTYYAFATYVFLLVCAGIWFFRKTARGAKSRDDKSAYEKEQRLFTLYQNVEDMLSGFEEFAEEAKKETGDALARSAQMMEELRQLSKQMNDLKAVAEPAKQRAVPRGIRWNELQESAASQKDEAQASQAAYGPAEPEDGFGEEQAAPPLKTNDKIQLLSAQGFSATEIAKTLGISVREVTLALELLRK